MELGDPISYLTLATGTAVLTRDGERIGVVEHVLADPEADIFDGLVIDARNGPGGWRFADAPQVESIHEHGVVLALGKDEAAQLAEPNDNPAVMSTSPDDTTPDDLGDKLRRAWDLISGRY
jgi:hypothetical protein